MNSYLRLFFYLFISLFAISCEEQSYKDSRIQRAERASKNKGDIIIGVSWAIEDDLFLQGVELAVKEINDSGGIVFQNIDKKNSQVKQDEGRKIKLIINTDETKFFDKNYSFEERQNIILQTAKDFVKNPDLVAVIGHSISSVAILASVMYQYHGVVFLAPSSTNIKLTGHVFDYVFRTIPNNTELATQAADYALKMGYKKFAILRTRGDYETELVDTFSAHVVRKKKDDKGDEKIELVRKIADKAKKIAEKAEKISDKAKRIEEILNKDSEEEILIEHQTDNIASELITTNLNDATEDDSATLEKITSTLKKIALNLKEIEDKFEEIKKIKEKTFDLKQKVTEIEIQSKKIGLNAKNIKQQAEAIRARIEDERPKIVYRRSFFAETLDIPALLVDLRRLKRLNNLDAIFIAANGAVTRDIYQQSRDMGVRVPFIGGETFDVRPFLELVEQWENHKSEKKSIIATVFNDSLEDKQIKEFVKNFKKNNDGKHPDYLAALGYDTVKVLAHAMKRANSTVPFRVADALRYMPPCLGVTGDFAFETNGDLKYKPIFFKSLKKTIPKNAKNKDKYDYDQIIKEDKDWDPNVKISNCNNIDFDNDGFNDDIDSCPENKPYELVKGVHQQGLSRGCPIDTDNDDVPDFKDLCPNNTIDEISKGVYQLEGKIGCPIDTDGDGTPDYKDGCPGNPKFTKFEEGQNCKIGDMDKDDIVDGLDKCPKNTLEQIAKGVYPTGDKKGCPIDTDEDAVADYMDECPNNTATELRLGVDNKGCPVDKDLDSIFDFKDKCPNTPNFAMVDKYGCGIVENSIIIESSDDLFNIGSSDLTLKGKAHLKALVAWIEKPLFISIRFETHTDSSGDSEKNQILTEQRAETIFEHLILLGISKEHIEFVARGDSEPIVSNETKKGREQNRRIEFHLMHYRNKVSASSEVNSSPQQPDQKTIAE